MNIHPKIQSIKNKIIETRRDFHKHPELSFKEKRTSRIVADRLNEFGIDVQRNIGKTGVIGTLNGNSKGKTIALRADMDALPMQETGDVPYKSINDGVMHACGHDAHTAMLLGAAEALSEIKEKIRGTIKFIFQPAEEGYGGAKFMIKDGALNNVEEIYGLHVWNYQASGTVGIKSGPVMAAADIFAATIEHYLAPIKSHLDDVTVSEVMINHADEVYIEKDGKLILTDARFADDEAYHAAVNNILQYTGKSLSDEVSLVDARLPNGSRVHVAKQPCARRGMVMTIRKFAKAMLDIDWLVELGTLTEQARQFLRIAVTAEQNLLVAGGTSSGKTSLLNALSAYIPTDQRIVVIEDSAELQVQQSHVISLESKSPDRFGRGAVTIRDLFRSSLRLRPDRIIIGEVRGGEALDMIQAMTSGHGGSMGTLHANSPSDTMNRLETLALMSEVELPLHALRAQAASAIDLVIQMSRQIGGRRLVTHISEVGSLDADEGRYVLRDLFSLKRQETGGRMQLEWTGERSALAERLGDEAEALVTDLTRAIFE